MAGPESHAINRTILTSTYDESPTIIEYRFTTLDNQPTVYPEDSVPLFLSDSTLKSDPSEYITPCRRAEDLTSRPNFGGVS